MKSGTEGIESEGSYSYYSSSEYTESEVNQVSKASHTENVDSRSSVELFTDKSNPPLVKEVQPKQEPTSKKARKPSPYDLNTLHNDVAVDYKYYGSRSFNWFSFRDEVKGLIAPITTYLAGKVNANSQMFAFSVTSLTDYKGQRYSIFEAEEAEFTHPDVEFGFPNAYSSQKSTDQTPPILRFAFRKSVAYSYYLFSVLQAVKVGLVAAVLSSESVAGKLGTSITVAVNMLEMLLYIITSLRDFYDFVTMERTIKSVMFEASAALASALPRTLSSECGFGKFLRKKKASPKGSLALICMLLLLLIVLSCIPLSIAMNPLFLPLVSVLSSTSSVIALVLISVCTASLFFPAKYMSMYCEKSKIYMMRSLACNLRGFCTSCNYALDFSKLHNISEGLCYFFSEKTPQVFIPFLAVKGARVCLEPISIKMTYKFSRREMALMDCRTNQHTIEVFKRGYDVVLVKDLVVWVVLELTNNLDMWLPLSLTQHTPTMFGFQGNELATLLDMSASSLDIELNKSSKDGENRPFDAPADQAQKSEAELQTTLREIADFCRYYHKLRAESVIEEAMYMNSITKVVQPTEVE